MNRARSLGLLAVAPIAVSCWASGPIGGLTDADVITDTDSDSSSDTGSETDGLTDPELFWSLEMMSSGTTSNLGDVWGSAPDDVYAVGEGSTIVHFDGSGWSPMETPVGHTLAGVWGVAADYIFAVGGLNESGDNGVVLFYDGQSWGVEIDGVPNLRAVTVIAPDTPFAVGQAGSILMRNNDTWLATSSGTDHDLHALWSDGDVPIYLGGHIASAFGSGWIAEWSWDGAEPMDHPTTGFVYAIWGASDDELFAAGWSAADEEATLFALDGDAWVAVDSSPHLILDLWGDAGRGLWAVGKTSDDYSAGVVLRWTEAGWQDEWQITETAAFSGVFGFYEEDVPVVFAVGRDGIIVRLTLSN